MTRYTHILIFNTLFSLIIFGCTPRTSPADNPEVAAALPSLVIDSNSFNQDYLKPCTHTKECTAPLACFNNACHIPPAITGKYDDSTPKISVETSSGTHSILLEIVDDSYTMQRGMMMRRSCQPGWGMLFVYQEVNTPSFWMHNTYIPLDIIFIRKDGSVANVAPNAEPLNDIPRYTATDRVLYVLELPAGTAASLGIKSGSRVDFSKAGLKK